MAHEAPSAVRKTKTIIPAAFAGFENPRIAPSRATAEVVIPRSPT
jgi:hypothetical protein